MCKVTQNYHVLPKLCIFPTEIQDMNKDAANFATFELTLMRKKGKVNFRRELTHITQNTKLPKKLFWRIFVFAIKQKVVDSKHVHLFP